MTRTALRPLLARCPTCHGAGTVLDLTELDDLDAQLRAEIIRLQASATPPANRAERRRRRRHAPEPPMPR